MKRKDWRTLTSHVACGLCGSYDVIGLDRVEEKILELEREADSLRRTSLKEHIPVAEDPADLDYGLS